MASPDADGHTGAEEDQTSTTVPIHDEIHTAVLFIHGMGETEPGDSLIRFVDPIVDAITRWSSRDGTAPVAHHPTTPAAADATAAIAKDHGRVTESESAARIRDRVGIRAVDHTLMRNATLGEVPHNPPHTILQLEGPPLDSSDGTSSRRNVLFVEAWWESEFAPPAFGDVAKWALGVGPYLIARHFTLRPEESNPDRHAVVKYARYAWALLVVLLFCLVIAALLVLSLLPYTKNWVRGVILTLIGSFGDVLAYASGAMRASAIRGSVVRSLKYLQEHRPKRTILIGYSLGSVIGYDVLNSANANADTYITFGSPLKKLNVLLQLQRERLRLADGIGLAMGGLALLVAAIALFVGSGGSPGALWDDFARHNAPSATAGWLTAALAAGVLAALGRIALWVGPPTRMSPTRLIAPLGSLVATLAALLGFVLNDPRDPALDPGALLPPWDVGAWTTERFVDLGGTAMLGVAAALLGWREIQRYRRDRATLHAIAPVLAAIDRLPPGTDSRVAEQLRWCVRACSTTQLEEAESIARRLGEAGVELLALLETAKGRLATVPSPVETGRLTRDRPLTLLMLGGALLVLGRFFDVPWSETRVTLVVPALLGAVALCWGTTRVVSRRLVPDHVLALTTRQRDPLRWIDLWASADPFTEFGLDSNTVHPDHITLTSREVFNGRNIIRDHSTYEANWEEMVGPVAVHLLETAGWSRLAAEQQAVLRERRAMRRQRVNERLWGTLALIGVALVGPFGLGLDGLRDLWRPLAFLNEPINPLLESFNIPTLPEAGDSTAWVMGLLLLWVATVLWYSPLLTGTWSQWDEAEATALFREAGRPAWLRGRRLGFLLVGVLVPAAALGLSVAAVLLRLAG